MNIIIMWNKLFGRLSSGNTNEAEVIFSYQVKKYEKENIKLSHNVEEASCFILDFRKFVSVVSLFHSLYWR